MQLQNKWRVRAWSSKRGLRDKYIIDETFLDEEAALCCHREAILDNKLEEILTSIKIERAYVLKSGEEKWKLVSDLSRPHLSEQRFYFRLFAKKVREAA